MHRGGAGAPRPQAGEGAQGPRQRQRPGREGRGGAPERARERPGRRAEERARQEARRHQRHRLHVGTQEERVAQCQGDARVAHLVQPRQPEGLRRVEPRHRQEGDRAPHRQVEVQPHPPLSRRAQQRRQQEGQGHPVGGVDQSAHARVLGPQAALEARAEGRRQCAGGHGGGEQEEKAGRGAPLRAQRRQHRPQRQRRRDQRARVHRLGHGGREHDVRQHRQRRQHHQAEERQRAPFQGAFRPPRGRDGGWRRALHVPALPSPPCHRLSTSGSGWSAGPRRDARPNRLSAAGFLSENRPISPNCNFFCAQVLGYGACEDDILFSLTIVKNIRFRDIIF